MHGPFQFGRLLKMVGFGGKIARTEKCGIRAEVSLNGVILK